MERHLLMWALPVLLVVSSIAAFGRAGDEAKIHAEIAKADTTFESGYSDVNGLKMYYEIHGATGDYLVLIHGGGSTIGTSFGRILPYFARDHRVVAVELQGHGHTNDRNSPESFEQDADDVVTLLHNLHIARASFLGFSNGGNTAMQIAIRHPGLVEKLVIASSFYKREGLVSALTEGLKHATLKDMPETLKKAFLEITPDSSKLVTMFNKDRQRMVDFKDWPDETLRSITSPTLIICGDRDIVLTSHAVAMATLITDARLMILPGAHGAYLGVAEIPPPAPGTVAFTARIVNDFLRGKL